MHSKMEALLARLRKQLTDLADKFMDVFRNTVNNLIETFAANKSYLDSMPETTKVYERPLAHIRDLKENLALIVKEMDVNAKATDFINMLLSEDGVKAWINSNENEIFIVVNQYFTNLFSTYSQKTMTSYLQDKYKDATTPEELTQHVRNDVMNNLDARARPLFWTATAYNVSRASSIGYITYPMVSSEVSSAAEQLSQTKPQGSLTTRASKIQDRISIMRCLVGAPLFGYQGLLLYEKASVNSPLVGKHLYEGKEYTNDAGERVAGRDWRNLPSPSPLSLMHNRNAETLKNSAEEVRALYEKAEDKKIIVSLSANDYGVQIILPSFMEKIRKIRDTAIGKTKVEQLEAIDQIKAMMEQPEFEPDAIKIPNDATGSLPESNKKLVRIDHFVSAPKIQEMVRKEMEKYNDVDKILEELLPKEDASFVAFQNALFTGVIRFNPPVVTCEDEYGTEFQLSRPNMTHGIVPDLP